MSSTDISDANVTFTHYDSVHDLIGDTSGERHVRAISQNAWVQVDSNKYILAARGGVLTLEKRTPTTTSSSTNSSNDAAAAPFHVIWKYSLPPVSTSKTASPWSKPRTVATATTLTSALHAADTFASNKFERLFIATSSTWRQGPASEGQLAFLNKLRIVTDEEPLGPEDLNKGQAADMITKVKFGARGRFDRLMGVRRKRERKEEKVKELRGREEVKVGPLNQ